MTEPHPPLDALVKAHQAFFLAQEATPAALPRDDSQYALVYAAARRLGFAPNDAKAIAQAWEHQSARLGGFDPDRWPNEVQDFGLVFPPEAERFATCPASLGVYAVLPSAAWVARMAQAGIPTLQLRYKSTDPVAIAHEIRAAVRAVEGTGCRLFINDHWQSAIAAGAYGVHLGQEDLDALPSAALAQIRAAGLRLGVSTHGYAEMLRAAAIGPSYIALGAVFPTTLKAMATPPQGLGRLYAYARLMRDLPLVAIGGITLADLPAIAGSGVGSFAVVRALTDAPDPQAMAHTLLESWAELRHANATAGN